MNQLNKTTPMGFWYDAGNEIPRTEGQMSRFSSLWLADYLARTNAPRRADAAPGTAPAGVEREIVGLHVPIMAECKRRGWKYVHSDTTRRTTIGEGTCDFIIYADGGRMFHVECKSRNGKLSIEQLAFIAWVEKLGHKVHVVTSMEGFFFIINSLNDE